VAAMSNDERVPVEDLVGAGAGFATFAGARGAMDPAALDFLVQVARDATTADVEGLSMPDLAALCAGLWRWTEVKRAEAQEVRLIEGRGANGKPVGRDILEICGPDMPFLVDSVMGEIGAQGIEVRAMFHPIVQVARTSDGARGSEGLSLRESLIQVHLPSLSGARRESLLTGVKEALGDVRLAVNDFAAMRARMTACVKELAGANTGASTDAVTEAIAFLRWLADDRFVFLGARSYDYPRDKAGRLMRAEPDILDELNLGILRDPLRMVLRRSSEPSILTEKVRAELEAPSPVIVAKSNLRCKVHRRAIMDYVGIKRYSEDGQVLGEDRFVGLFTQEVYNDPARSIPMLKGKLERVIQRAGMAAGSHNDKKLRDIVDHFPRDELFQITEDDLLRIATGVQHLMDRPRTRLFVRRDRFDRFVSVLVFVPRDRYNSDVRSRVGELLARAWGGRLSAFYPLFGEAPLARVHYIIGLDPSGHPEPDVSHLEDDIVAITRTWDDALEALAGTVGTAVSAYLGGFPAGYRDEIGVEEAMQDIAEMEKLAGDEVRVRAFRLPGDGEQILRCKLYHRGTQLQLSDAIPVLESMGLFVESETPHDVRRGSETIWISDVRTRSTDSQTIDYGAVEGSFEEAFAAIWAGKAEVDGFNRLILKLGISWREATLVRALARWRGQTGMDPSQQVQEQAVADHPAITRAILSLFSVRFDPGFGGDRETAATSINETIANLLNAVPSLDADRVLRRLAGMVNAMQRTNYFQPGADGTPKPYMSFKIATREIAEVPNPKPFREIWVWSPQVEGAHLRFGPVARGGLRWSDRRDDFRTEVLGLVKAQQVKNAVIVPVGSKGAFFPKQLPRGGSREEVQAAGIAAYRTFLCGLLDLTDNIAPDGSIVPPRHVVRRDGDDPYLVVAADKGTATFSDIANGISAEYGHWLGDAFASGGSNGYDHKKMGITARGGWEAVKRHFREMGRDCQSEPFTVIGVGDMSGDVFGNGMLLSPATRLLAAFDHRDIFLDPDPDPATSLAERQRMFALPRSSWADYDKSLISPGGGVFSRSAKAIPLSPQVKALTGLEADEVSPAELMHALLKSPCDLMWFGGIGTYVKASSETHQDAGDKANDPIRVNGSELRAKVMGEGANLGLTQRGRIEAARSGVRLNTDAIDNSAGVDSSDHEVNIKILLGGLVRSGQMSEDGRDTLLAEMTEDVGLHVLRHNYDQTLALTLQQATAPADLNAHARFMEGLEKQGRLDRAVEYLPGRTEIGAMAERGDGMTRPHLAVLTAYAKLELFDDIVASDAPDDPWFRATLETYFPPGCRAFGEAMQGHRLKREIIATVLANEMVNLGGATFMDRVRESAMAGTGAIVRAFAAARAIFGLDAAVASVNALDLKAPAEVQTRLMLDIVAVLRRQSFWLARRAQRGGGISGVGALVDAYGAGVASLKPLVREVISPFERARVDAHAADLVAAGAPEEVTRAIASLRPLISATDIIDIATVEHCAPEAAARIYHKLGEAVGFDELRAAAGLTASPDHWDRVATRRIIEDLMSEQSAVAQAVCRFAARASGSLASGVTAPTPAWADEAVSGWLARHRSEADRAAQTLAELRASGNWSFAKLAIANTQLKEFAATAGR
jgi:glutamate dehydrogenase